jgi:uncharacterized alpha-E superfamily protein
MLSRVADNLYWMSRYLERAEHTARLLDVNLNLMLELTSTASVTRNWGRMLTSLYAPIPETIEAQAIAQSLTFDVNNAASIVACIDQARDNARHVREQISSEMWEQLNRLFLSIKAQTIESIWMGQPHEFYRMVKEGAHLFQGITDSTMNHGEGWQFIQLGRSIERASSVAHVINVYFSDFPDLQYQDSRIAAKHYIEWLGLLKSCTAFEAYCKVYSADLQPQRIIEFLLLNAEFPHSVRFSIDMLQNALNNIAEMTATRKNARAHRYAGRLKAALSYAQIDEISDGGLHEYLTDIQHQCGQIHTGIYQIYIDYPIDEELAS